MRLLKKKDENGLNVPSLNRGRAEVIDLCTKRLLKILMMSFGKMLVVAVNLIT